MDLHEALKLLHASKEYKTFSKASKGFLAHAFVMVEKGAEEWQIGYFCADEDRMYSFIIGKKIEALPPAEVLKADVTIHELHPADVKITPAEALDIAEQTRKKHYSADLPIKVFYLIQHLPEGAVYNITYVTQRFTTMNIKILAKDGTVHKHSNEPLIAFDKGGPSTK
jgi:hypothetical protein